MTTEVTTNESFQERMFKRVREQMGDLMTEAELKTIVDTALHKAFFEERVIKSSHWNTPDTKKPSAFVELLQEELKQPIREGIQAWLAEHPEKVNEVITETIGKGFLGILHSYIEQKTNEPIFRFANDLRNMGVLK